MRCCGQFARWPEAGPHPTTLLAVAAARWPDRAAVIDDDGTARYSDLTQTAQRLHAAAGGEDSPTVLFSIDEDIDLNTWKSVAVDWFRGLNSVLGVDRTGIYGHSRACRWAIEDGVIGRSTTAGHRWAWQTSAWSHGEREPMAVLYQAVVNSPSNPSPLLGGIHVDLDDILATDYGQWDLHR